jgi:hypothetical protein
MPVCEIDKLILSCLLQVWLNDLYSHQIYTAAKHGRGYRDHPVAKFLMHTEKAILVLPTRKTGNMVFSI